MGGRRAQQGQHHGVQLTAGLREGLVYSEPMRSQQTQPSVQHTVGASWAQAHSMALDLPAIFHQSPPPTDRPPPTTHLPHPPESHPCVQAQGPLPPGSPHSRNILSESSHKTNN